MFKDVPDQEHRGRATIRSTSRCGRWTAAAIEKGLIGVAGERRPARALKRHPDRFIPCGHADPNEGMDARPPDRPRLRDVRASARSACSRPARPAGADQRQEDVPDLREVRGARASRSSVCAGIPGPRLTFAASTSSCIDEVMYDFPELVFVTRHGCEPWTGPGRQAHAQVAEPPLLDQRVRPEALPEGHRRLRQHPRRRQDHLRRLLPDGAVARAHHDRDGPTCRSRTRSGPSSSAATPPGSSASTRSASTPEPRCLARRRPR